MKDTDFIRADYTSFDMRARSEAKKLLYDLYPDSKVYDNPDQYDCDIILERNEKETYFEVEYKKFSNYEMMYRYGGPHPR